MKWTRVLAFSMLMMAVLGVSSAFAVPVSFSDNSNYWPNWSNGTGNDNTDVIGAPNFTGGVVEVASGGYLKSITVNQSSGSDNYSLLTAGDLFIDKNGDHVWDYFVDLTAWTTPGTGNPNPAAGSYDVWSISLPVGSKANNPGYILSGADNTGGWAGYLIRAGHPVAVGDSVSKTDTLTDVFFSGWHDSNTESWTFTFDDGAIFLGEQFAIGWTTNCANDVIYETMNNPVPEPATMLLLGAGLVGLAGFRKRLKKS